MRRKRVIKIILFILAGVSLLVVSFIVYATIVSRVHPPTPSSLKALEWQRQDHGHDFYTVGNNWLRKSESGLYELYVEGEPFERGVANGKLTQALVQRQEEVFTQQIHQLVPSDFYLRFLTFFVSWFNRDLEKFVPEENKLEIYGVSQAASHEFDNIGTPYQRILNYHAAHDIGHALQNMALVGCTSFAVWDSKSADSTLTIGRNFDFFVGEKFAEDKIVAFYNPDKGNKFMMITWGGMTGVLSGMNIEGLTVTINAAKSEIPSGSATPVSLVAREILQYASTIEEAYAIAKKRKMFVAESFLIGSARDRRAAVIEKTPDGVDMYDPKENQVVCTNHFQGDSLGNTELNREHMKTSASPYRYKRVEQLLAQKDRLSVEDVVSILRNQKGMNDADIGLGNEKAINQLVAHHGIVFQPEKKLVWVSTAPWQLGKFVCYDLNKVFQLKMTENTEVYDSMRTIPADSFLLTKAYRDYCKFFHYRFPFEPRQNMQPDSMVRWNPNSYHAYMIAGDFYFDHEDFAKAGKYYEEGLTKEVPTIPELLHMQENLKTCKERQ